ADGRWCQPRGQVINDGNGAIARDSTGVGHGHGVAGAGLPLGETAVGSFGDGKVRAPDYGRGIVDGIVGRIAVIAAGNRRRVDYRWWSGGGHIDREGDRLVALLWSQWVAARAGGRVGGDVAVPLWTSGVRRDQCGREIVYDRDGAARRPGTDITDRDGVSRSSLTLGKIARVALGKGQVRRDLGAVEDREEVYGRILFRALGGFDNNVAGEGESRSMSAASDIADQRPNLCSIFINVAQVGCGSAANGQDQICNCDFGTAVR